jgi:N-acetylmuramoyl-L-alanine amidase
MAQRGIHTIPVADALVKQLRVAETQPGVTRIVIDLKQAVELTTSQLNSPNRLMVEVRPKGAKTPVGDGSEKPLTTSLSGPGSGSFFGGQTLPDAPMPPATVASAGTPANAKTPMTKTASAKVVVASNLAVPPLASSAAMASNAPGAVKTRDTDASETSAKPVTPAVTPKPRETLKSALKSAAVKNSEAASAEKSTNEKSKIDKSVNDRSVNDRSVNDKTAENRIDDRKAGTFMASLPPEPVDMQALSEKSGSDKTIFDKTLSDRSVTDRSVSDRDDVKEVLPAKPGAMNDRSLVRTLGLKLGRVVIDAGHGGNDVGTHGPSGYLEKDLSLDVAKRLAALIRENMGSEVVLTRSDDVYVGLEERTRIANEHKADLFLSIHANSSPYRSAAGVETFVLNFTTNKSVMDLATRENAGSEMSIHDLQDLLQKIALRDKVDESRELAARLQTSLSKLSTNANDAARNRGVKKAPFVVLIGANMPSVLAEIGFLTNTADEALLRKPEHRQKIADALYQGIASYAATLSQVVARKN